MNLYIAILSLFLVKIDHIDDHVLQIDGLRLNVKTAAKFHSCRVMVPQRATACENRVDVFHQFGIVIILFLMVNRSFT